MADVGNPNDEAGGKAPETVTPTPEQVKAARRTLLDKFEVESARTSQSPQTQQNDDSDDDEAVDLTGLDPQVASAIRKKLKAADAKSKHVNTLAQFGIEQAQRAKALELGREFGLDDDEIARVQKALGSARNPDAVDLAGRELAIKLREDGSVTVAAAPKGKQDDSGGGTTPPPVDQGRGGGSNRAAVLADKLDAIDPYADPAENQKLLDSLKKDADAAQSRFMERAGRR